MKKTQIANQYRNFNIRSGNINEEERTVELSFSSEEPVKRYFGQEILDHNPESVDLTRLNGGAPVLEDHKDGQIGRVMEASIVDGRGVAKVKLSRSARGEEIWQDVLDGIRTSISFGYQILGWDEEEDAEEPTFRSRNWLPFEISFVGVPADHTVGVGRSKEEVTNEIEVSDNFRNLEAEIILDTTKEIEEDLNESDTEDISDNSHARAKLKLAKAASKGIK